MFSKYFDFRKLLVPVAVVIAVTVFSLITSCGPKEYILTTSIVPNNAGTITIPDKSSYIAGAKVDIVANPANGYKFDHWEGDAAGTTNSISISMDKGKSVIACFKAQYMLNTSVEPSGSGVVTPERDIFGDGTKVTINASPVSGYKFDYWSGDIESKTSSTSIIMDSKKNVIAHFKPLSNLTVSVSPVGAGTTSPSSGYYDFGAEVTITASPSSGYAFDHWSGDIENDSNPQSVSMDKNRNLVVYFNPSSIDLFEGQSKGLIDIMGYGSDSLDRVSLKITSKIKSTISVNISPGIVFTSTNTHAFYSRMISLGATSISLNPGDSKQIVLPAASMDGITQLPGKSDLLMPNTSAPEDLKLLVKVKGLSAATFRVQQYAVWVICLYPADVNSITIGTKGTTAYQGPTQAEFDQIRSLFQQAGIAVEKYPLKYVNLQK